MKQSFYKILGTLALALLLAVETCLVPAANASAQEITQDEKFTEQEGTDASGEQEAVTQEAGDTFKEQETEDTSEEQEPVIQESNNTSHEQPISDIDSTEQTFETRYTIVSQWNSGYNAEITLTNTGDKTIHNWMLEFQTSDRITSLWNGTIHYQEGDIYRIKNAGWNQEIKSGEGITFGFTAEYTEDVHEPQNFRILSFQRMAESNQYEIAAVITNAWETGYIMQVSIENISDTLIEHWGLTFDFPKEIKNIWNAELENHTDTSYQIHNDLHNSNIEAGQKVWFECEVITVNHEQSFPENVRLDISCFEEDNTEDDEATSKDGSYLDVLYVYYDIDKDVEDNDKDGIPDKLEMLLLGLNPTMTDSDENGILDGDEDYDEDGLSNLRELELGTDPANADSDYDGLSDGEECNIYFTNPLDEDTDKDSLTDYDEVQLGTDPLTASTDGITQDAERYFTQTLPEGNIDLDSEDERLLMPSVTMDMAGYIGSHVSIANADMDTYLSNRSIIGTPILIVNDKEADTKSATLSFDVSSLVETDAYKDGNIRDISICKLDGYVPEMEGEAENPLSEIPADEEEQYVECEDGGLLLVAKEEEPVTKLESKNYSYQPLVTTFSEENGTLSAAIDGSGIYMVVNEMDLLRSVGLDFLSQDKAEPDLTMGQADVVFVVDTTGSMSANIKQTADSITSFVNTLTNEYQLQTNFALIEYRDITIYDEEDSTRLHHNGLSDWYSDAQQFSEVIKELAADGGGDWPETLVDALGLASTLDYRENADKYIVIITDANYKIDNNYGYESLEAVIDTLDSQGIITSVVTYPKYEDTYSYITEKGGMYCNLKNFFSKELKKLIDLIGVRGNDGFWFLLDNYEYVKLAMDYNNLGSLDSDGDGLTDLAELGEPVNMSFTPFAKNLLLRYGDSLSDSQQQKISNAIDSGYFFKLVYKMVANPQTLDTDMDGIPDKVDESRCISFQTGYLYHKKATFHSGISDVSTKQNVTTGYKIRYDLNFKDFFLDNKEFNKRLCVASCVFAGLAYNKGNNDPDGAADDYYCFTDKEKSKKTKKIAQLMSRHGFYNIKIYNIGSDTHQTKCYIAIKDVVYYGKKLQVIAVIIKGTDGTAAQWSSNFNIGMGVSNAIDKDSDWTNLYNHKGFDIAANRVYKKITAYVKKYRNTKMPLAYWVTGHSRGAAIANILSAKLTDNNNKVFAYTFATPNTTTSKTSGFSKYDCIFNTVNARDFVPTLPCEDWGFSRYGNTASIAMSEEMQKVWNARMKADYKGKNVIIVYNEMSKNNLKRLVESLANITKNRTTIYEYGAANQSATMGNAFVYNGKGGLRTTFLTNTIRKELQAVQGYEISLLSLSEVKVKQSPMYFMQIVAAKMPCENEPKSNRFTTTQFLKHNVADKYESAKEKLVSSLALKGISHAHYVDTYIIITNKVESVDFK